MKNKQLRARIYKTILDLLETKAQNKAELIDAICNKENCAWGTSAVSDCSKDQKIRVTVGEALTAMEGNRIVKSDENGVYTLLTEKPIALRMEKCEKQILSVLSHGSVTKKQLTDDLAVFFGTKKTKSQKDDAALYQFTSQILKRLIGEKTVYQNGNVIGLCPNTEAEIDNRKEMLELKNIFLIKLHSKGGEFFEEYFVKLISKYLTATGKKVLDSQVTAGSDDGGIDGIVRTEDSLGFRETVMIQTKNRNVTTNETDVRGFYGAVCAKRGTRGIYAITSVFHKNAKLFIDSLDDCVGIDGNGIFDLAVKCRYGIVKVHGKLALDTKIFD